MAENTIIDSIQNQINATSTIFEKLEVLRQVSSRQYESTNYTSGKFRYDKATISSIEEEINKWQYKTKAVLAACFGDENEHKKAFERTIVDHFAYYDAKEELIKELREGCNVLRSIIDKENLKAELRLASSHKDNSPKKPLVFISHRGTQEAFVTELVELFEKCGFTGENLFCSSVPGFNIGLDKDIVETLRKKFVEYDLYVVYVFSNDFFESAYCLNEMGAAWVLQVDNSIIVTRDMDESKIDGVVNKTKIRISFKDTDLQLKTRMIELRDKLLDFAGLKRVTDINWTRYYEKFIGEVRKIDVKKASNKTTANNTLFSIENPDDVIMKAIYRLGEFTIKQLQDETKIENYHYIAKKINALVLNGTLVTEGSQTHRKYRLKI